MINGVEGIFEVHENYTVDKVIINTWLHTRAFKYNLSALGTYFESEGVKCTYLSFT